MRRILGTQGGEPTRDVDAAFIGIRLIERPRKSVRKALRLGSDVSYLLGELH
jgi:hypothetical protein